MPSFSRQGHLARIIVRAHSCTRDSIIHVDKQDTITLLGVINAERKAHPSDFALDA